MEGSSDPRTGDVGGGVKGPGEGSGERSSEHPGGAYWRRRIGIATKRSVRDRGTSSQYWSLPSCLGKHRRPTNTARSVPVLEAVLEVAERVDSALPRGTDLRPDVCTGGAGGTDRGLAGRW